MDENERYTEVCKPAFDRIEAHTSEILRVLKGQDGAPGLIDEVRDLKKFRNRIIGAFVFVFSAIFIQVGAWVRSRFGG